MDKLIENKLPIEFISGLSKKEANSRKSIYGIHKWFARKTDAIYRSLLISLELKEDSAESFKRIYYENNSELLKDKIILDPFCGGGTTLINALRLGAKPIGNDLNPMAWFIVKNELQLPGENSDINRLLREEYDKIEKSVGSEIKKAYTTRIYDKEGCQYIDAEVIYTFWIKKCTCPHCKEEIKLFPRYSLTNTRTSNQDTHICSECGDIIYVDKEEFRENDHIINCNKCGNNFDSDKGVCAGRNIICPYCGEKFSLLKDIMTYREKPLPMDMYALEYYDPSDGRRHFKIPDSSDLKKLQDIINIAESDQEYKDFIRDSEDWRIPQGQNTKQLTNHKYYFWTQMFNERQSYFLFRILKEIQKIENQTVKELFLCTFSNMLNANNMFCIYNAQCDKLEPLFGDHHMAPVTNPVENNIWGTRYGRGSFSKYFNIMLQAKDFNFHPYERIMSDGLCRNIYIDGEAFMAKFASDFHKLKYDEFNVMLKCVSSERLDFIPDSSIDAVVTDPPYFGAINYGEISEFFYVWNRTVLKGLYPCFDKSHVSKKEEVTVNSDLGISGAEFCRRLTACFKEIKRVLKPGAPFIFTYNNSSIEGWEALYNSLDAAGFYIVKNYPVHTELRAGLIDSKRSKMNFDLVFLCKGKEYVSREKRTVNTDDFFRLIDKAYAEIKAVLESFGLNESDICLIKTGIALEQMSAYSCRDEDRETVDFKKIIGKIYS